MTFETGLGEGTPAHRQPFYLDIMGALARGTSVLASQAENDDEDPFVLLLRYEEVDPHRVQAATSPDAHLRALVAITAQITAKRQAVSKGYEVVHP